MKPAWTVTTYVRSELPLTNKVASVMSLTFVVMGCEEPKKETVEALACSHVRNVELIFSEVDFTPIPDDLLPDN